MRSKTAATEATTYKTFRKELLVLILGQPPSTTSLDPHGAEVSNLIGRDKP